MSTFQLEKLIISFITLILGIVLIVIDGSFLASILFIVIGLIIFILNIVPLIEAAKYLKYRNKVAVSQFISALITIIISILLIFFQRRITILIGIFLIVISIINMVVDNHHWKTELKYQLPLFIIGVLLVSVGFGFILDFTYKWGHTVFIFLWLIALSIMLSRPIHVITNGKIPFFFKAEWYSIVYAYMTSALSIYQ